ncbi:MAG: 16S rRNA processing protein RimM [Muribaculaceae bacterium]|jgi:16S rRNA processing protein RimM|nr:16S rRNA processing protein RimM [Muribaculaceae bacterium]
MIVRDQLIAVGRFNKAHGVNGEVQATLDIDADLLPRLRCIVTDVDGIYVPFFIASHRNKGTQSVLLTIDGITSEQQAAMILGREFYALKEDYDLLNDELEGDELPLDYFIGFELFDHDTPVGHIDDVDDTTANVLFVVKRPDGSHVQVPAADEWVVAFDPDQRTITMDLPQGLLEL